MPCLMDSSLPYQVYQYLSLPLTQLQCDLRVMCTQQVRQSVRIFIQLTHHEALLFIITCQFGARHGITLLGTPRQCYFQPKILSSL